MDSYNNRSPRGESDLTALILKQLGVFDSQRLTELSGEALAAISVGSCFVAPSRKVGGYRYEVRYPNGFAASIIKHYGSYGGEADLWEVAVMSQNEEGEWRLCYTTEITDDVLGFLTESDVVAVCDRIRALN